MLRKYNLLILLLLFVSFSLKSQIKSSVVIKNTEYSYVILNKNQTNENHFYEIDFYYPVITYIGKDTINDTIVFLKTQKVDAATFNTFLVSDEIDEITEMLNNLLILTHFKQYIIVDYDTSFTYKFAGREDAIKIDTLSDENVEALLTSNELGILASANKIKKQIELLPATIEKQQITSDLKNETDAGTLTITPSNISIYRRGTIALSAIPTLFDAILMWKKDTNSNSVKHKLYQLVKNDSINKFISIDSCFLIDYNILNSHYFDVNSFSRIGGDKDELDVLNKEIKVFKRKLKRLNKNKRKKYIRYKYKKIESKPIPFNTCNLESGQIVFENSQIKYITAQFNNGKGFYSTYPIPVRAQASIIRNKDYRLFNYPTGKQALNYVVIGDLFEYCFDLQNYTDDFSPKDQVLRFNVSDGDNTFKLKSQSINSVFDIRVYSDLTAMFGNEPAGIIQTEGTAHFKLNSSFPSKSSVKFGNYFEPVLNYSAFKDEKSTLKFTNYNWGVDTTIKVDALNLQRYSNFSTGLQLNLIRFGMKKLNSTFDVNFFTTILNTKTSFDKTDSVTFTTSYNSDTTISTTTYPVHKNLYSLSYGVNLLWRTMKFKHFGIDVSLKLYGLTILNGGDDYELVNSMEFEEDKYPLVFLYNPSATLFYKPKVNGAGSWFLRSIYYGCFSNNINSYLFVQIGYSLSISDLINKAPKPKY